jgi:glycosyltransferase involved in cell wall biosynthesis
VTASPRKVAVLSAHEGSASWRELLRSLEATGVVTIHRSSSFSDDEYRNSRSRLERAALRVKTYLLYPLSVIANSYRLSRSFDTILVITSPFYLPAIVGLFVRGPRIIVLQNDIYPEALIVKKLITRGGFADRLFSRVMTAALERATVVVYITEEHRTHVSRVMGVRAVDCVIPVPSYLDSGNGSPNFERTSGPITILYSGTLGKLHDTSTIVEYLEHERIPPHIKFVFRTSGSGKAAFERLVAARLGEVLALGVLVLGDPLPDVEWSAMMHSAEVGLVLQDTGAGDVVFPSKAASILTAGQAVLAIADEASSLGRLVLEYDCGWVVPPGNLNRLEAALSEAASPMLLQKKRANARRAGLERFSIEVVSDRWLKVLSGD